MPRAYSDDAQKCRSVCGVSRPDQAGSDRSTAWASPSRSAWSCDPAAPAGGRVAALGRQQRRVRVGVVVAELVPHLDQPPVQQVTDLVDRRDQPGLRRPGRGCPCRTGRGSCRTRPGPGASPGRRACRSRGSAARPAATATPPGNPAPRAGTSARCGSHARHAANSSSTSSSDGGTRMHPVVGLGGPVELIDHLDDDVAGQPRGCRLRSAAAGSHRTGPATRPCAARSAWPGPACVRWRARNASASCGLGGPQRAAEEPGELEDPDHPRQPARDVAMTSQVTATRPAYRGLGHPRRHATWAVPEGGSRRTAAERATAGKKGTTNAS